MMRVALIGDIHANLPALEAVLAHAVQNQADAIWNLGDFIGYGAFPEEVTCRMRTTNTLSIIGNYDRKALKAGQKSGGWKKHMQPEKRLAFKWSYDQLSPASREYLEALPEQRRLETAGLQILLTHGSPASISEHLAPDTPEDRMAELAKMAKAEIVLCAHAHIPFSRKVNSTWFVNSGSVGRPDDGDPRASYAMLIFHHGQFMAEFQRIAYDIERAAAAIHQAQLPEAFAQMVRLGRNLDWINDHLEK